MESPGEIAIIQTRACMILPPKVQSIGLWKGFAVDGNFDWLNYAFPRLEIFIALIFLVTQSSHFFLKRLGLPIFISQLLAGLLLSPSVIGETAAKKLATEESIQVLATMGTFGYAFFLFLIGVKMDPIMITRVSKRAFFIGALPVIIPLLFAITILEFFSKSDEHKLKTLFLLPFYTLTSFPVITCLLSEMKILNSELGRIGLSSAIVSDLLSIFILLVSTVVRVSVQVNITAALYSLGYVVSFLAFVFLLIRPGIKKVMTHIPEGKSVNQIVISIIVLLFLLCLACTKWVNDYMLLGVYILGLSIPDGPPLGSALVEKLESMVLNLFLPIFVTTCGMRAEKFFISFDNHLTNINALSAFVSLLVKFVVSLFPPLCSKMPVNDAVALALIMNSKGLVEIGIFTFLYDDQVIDGEIYSFMFYIILSMASVVPILVKLLYDPSRKYAGYQKRNIMASRPNAELQIVACVHVPDNVSAIINLLDVSCPSQDNTIAVNVLHLIKLNGQSTPLFVSHQKNKKAISNYSYSENVIIAFSKFEGANWGTVSVNSFTAISPPNLMQDDICNLALDKLASLIILPFHRTWNINGSVESDDQFIRTLNSKVLEKSPCSVGILIDRGSINMRRPVADPLSEPEYNVGIIFLGGPDDREALTFAKRMARNTRISLTLIHLTAAETSNVSEEWTTVVDNVLIREIKTNCYINYVHKEVKDGPETAIIIRSLINEFNLMIVGRRENLESQQTSGLKDWSEFPELGIMGDLLASMDKGRCSVLVVQQQQKT